MTPPDIVSTIRLILRLTRGDAAGVARCLAAHPIAADRLVTHALAGGLGVVLLRAIGRDPAAITLTAADRQRLTERQDRQEQRSAAQLAALAALADTFAARDQPFILLKGPYLAARFYGDIAGREFVDFDLLVPAADRRRVAALIEAGGYRRRSRAIGGQAVTGFFVHGFDYAAGPARLDLHWSLSRHPSLRIDHARLWAARRQYAIAGRDYSVLSDEHELVFAAVSLLRDLERGRPKAKNVVDVIQVAAAVDASLDWQAVLTRARTEGTLGPLVNVLMLCLDVADAHDLAPRLSATLANHPRLIPRHAGPDPFTLVPAAWGIGNKWWSARVYDTSVVAWACWWAASLPFRLAVHRRPASPSRAAGA